METNTTPEMITHMHPKAAATAKMCLGEPNTNSTPVRALIAAWWAAHRITVLFLVMLAVVFGLGVAYNAAQRTMSAEKTTTCRLVAAYPAESANDECPTGSR